MLHLYFCCFSGRDSSFLFLLDALEALCAFTEARHTRIEDAHRRQYIWTKSIRELHCYLRTVTGNNQSIERPRKLPQGGKLMQSTAAKSPLAESISASDNISAVLTLRIAENDGLPVITSHDFLLCRLATVLYAQRLNPSKSYRTPGRTKSEVLMTRPWLRYRS